MSEGRFVCARCGARHDRARKAYPHQSSGWCRPCGAAWAREYRRPERYREWPVWRKKKKIARAMARIAVTRGQLVRKPCEFCGDTNSVIHHEDYSKPLEVMWLCTPCHRAHHRQDDVVARMRAQQQQFSAAVVNSRQMSASARSTLSIEDVHDIREALETERVCDIARRYNLCPSTISHIKSRANWAWLPERTRAKGEL